MNIEDVLQRLQDFRSQLSDWGITNGMLWTIAGVAAVLFLLSVREVVCWFFRIHALRDEVRGLRKQLADLQRTLNEASVAPEDTPAPLKPEELVRIAEGMREPAPKFRLDH
jgi:hypothetical protein